MKLDLSIVIPVHNDWESLHLLLPEIENAVGNVRSLRFILVNDSSTSEPEPSFFKQLRYAAEIIELSRNMGHQNAIAIGLAYANEHHHLSQVIIMDSDGEDRPADIPRLLSKGAGYDGVIFAKRAKRSEGILFRCFYTGYKFLFFLLTGKKISFGNFCFVPTKYLGKIAHVPNIWNHFSGGIIRSGVPYTSVATQRGKRYQGESKMNFTRLILHGLSAVAVYVDIMALRLILLSFFLIITTLVGIGGVAFIRLFTHLAVPGWATFTVLGLGTILFLALFLSLFLLFNVLSIKNQKNIIPAKDYQDYIIGIKTMNANE